MDPQRREWAWQTLEELDLPCSTSFPRIAAHYRVPPLWDWVQVYLPMCSVQGQVMISAPICHNSYSTEIFPLPDIMLTPVRRRPKISDVPTVTVRLNYLLIGKTKTATQLPLRQRKAKALQRSSKKSTNKCDKTRTAMRKLWKFWGKNSLGLAQNRKICILSSEHDDNKVNCLNVFCENVPFLFCLVV